MSDRHGKQQSAMSDLNARARQTLGPDHSAARPWRHVTVLAINAIAFAVALAAGLAPHSRGLPSTAAAAPAVTAPGPTTGAAEPIMRVSTICTECAPFAHAASLVATGESLLAFWYQGAREGGFDVSIHSSRFDGTAWTKPEQVADQMSIAAELGRFVKSLGNPVAYAAPDGKITLFFVAVAMRGWATAYIAFKQSDDGGRTWSPARPLVTSPVWNLSTMIKTAPLKLPNGRIGLPAYWSLGTTYPVMIELTEAMQVADIKRMAPRGVGLQPAIAQSSGGHYVALLRTLSKEVGKTGLRSITSNDGGETWSAPRETGLGNPGAPVSVMRFDEGRLALIFNDKNEDNLAVIFSSDGGATWGGRVTMPDEKHKDKRGKAYPFAIANGSGIADMVYSCGNYSTICHARFNTAWTGAQPATSRSRQ